MTQGYNICGMDRIFLDTGRDIMSITIHKGQACTVKVPYRGYISEQFVHDTDLLPQRLVERVEFPVMIATGTRKMSFAGAVSR